MPKLTAAAPEVAGMAEWMAMHIWQCSWDLVKGCAWAIWTVAAQTKSSTQRTATNRVHRIRRLSSLSQNLGRITLLFPAYISWMAQHRSGRAVLPAEFGRRETKMLNPTVAALRMTDPERSSSKRRSMKRFCHLAMLFLLLAGVSAFAQEPHQRLILKDGTYQIVTKYQVVGDRVRYQSAERGGEWEELPKELVDWAATEKWAKEHKPGAHPEDQAEAET
jgi:hypothetical protein